MPLWERRIPIDAMRPYLYDGCTGIFFAIHTSRRFARQVGLPGIILQGTATLAYGVREMINREAGADPLRLKTVSCRFTGMVFPGTSICVQLLSRKLTQKRDGPPFCRSNGAGDQGHQPWLCPAQALGLFHSDLDPFDPCGILHVMKGAGQKQ